MAMIEQTRWRCKPDYDDYDAIVVVGGQSPMFTFRGHEELENALGRFYEAERRARSVTALPR